MLQRISTMSYRKNKKKNLKRRSLLQKRKKTKKISLATSHITKLTSRQNYMISAVALIPQAVILLVIFIAIYLKLKRPIFNRKWIDGLCIFALFPLAYLINYGFMIAFQSQDKSQETEYEDDVDDLTVDDV